MGSHASADIIFGILVHDPEGETIIPWGEDQEYEDFEEWVIATQSDIQRPDEDYPSRNDTSPEAERIREIYSDFWSKKREIMESLPIESDFLGYSDGFACEYLKLRGWGKRTGYEGEEISPRDILITNDHRIAFANGLAILGLDLPDPKIILAASYG